MIEGIRRGEPGVFENRNPDCTGSGGRDTHRIGTGRYVLRVVDTQPVAALEEIGIGDLVRVEVRVTRHRRRSACRSKDDDDEIACGVVARKCDRPTRCVDQFVGTLYAHDSIGRNQVTGCGGSGCRAKSQYAQRDKNGDSLHVDLAAQGIAADPGRLQNCVRVKPNAPGNCTRER